MSLDLATTLRISSLAIAVAVILQSLELLAMRKAFSNHGIWRWSSLDQDFQKIPRAFYFIFKSLLSESSFILILLSRVVIAAEIFILQNPGFLLYLALTNLLISARFRGTFNGGSDCMTLVVLLALSVASLYPESPAIQQGALWYIAIQVTLSYFVSGVIKIKRAAWRNGTALSAFLSSQNIYQTWLSRKITHSKPLSLKLSWLVMIFECIFPVALVVSAATPALLAFAFIFHLVNFYLLGLNRFIFAWLAAYPAVIYCSHLMGH